VRRNASRVSPHDCAVSTVTTYELLAGARKCRKPEQEERRVATFVGTIRELAFHRRAAERAAQARAYLEERGVMIGPYDLLLAGQALADGLTIVTSNTEEFGRVPDLRIVNWREARPSSG